jgi:pyruvate dehydrogenase (quinone)
VAHEYVATIVDAMQVRHCVDRAFRIARSQRTVTCLIVPSDVQSYDAIESPPHAHNTIHSSSAYTTPRVVPQKSDLDRAAAILNAGERVAMLVGAGTLRASEEVEQVAERLSAGVAKALLGKAAVPDTLPYVTGSIGLLGTKPSWDMMQDCDTLLMVGTSFPYAEFLPEEGQARGIQIDIDQRMLGLRYATELNLAGDAKETLQALLPRLRQKPRGSWREGIEKGVADWWHLMEERAMDAANPINPQRVIWELSPRIPENAIVSADSGSVANWFARDLKLRDGMMASLSGNLATMCPGVPYAIAAKFAYPERPVVALVGDGAMQMLGNNGLVTISHYWREWADPRFVILVLHNNDLNQVTWEMRVLEGNARFDASQELVDFNYARLADSLGLRGIEVTRPEDIAGAWEQAFVADRPVVLDMHTDPDVPPLPPHITFEQARHFATSMLKRDSSAVGVMKETARQFVSGFQR